MKARARRILIAALAVAPALSLFAAPQARTVPGRYIVTLRPDAVRSIRSPKESVAVLPTVDQVARGLALAHGGAVGRRFDHALEGYVALTDEAGAERLRHDPRVAAVTPDAWVDLAGMQVAPPSWGLDRIDQRPVDLDGVYAYPNGGAGVDVYVVDTGIRSTHEEFGGRVDTSRAFSTLADGYGSEDCNGHGTAVAGVIGAATYGGAKQVTLHPVRVFDCSGNGTISDILAGLDWVASDFAASRVKKGKRIVGGAPAVVNMSFEVLLYSAVNGAVDSLVRDGITAVAAAGNDADDACWYSPSSTDSAIVVGSTNPDDTMSSFSNWGPCVDLYAPGYGITTTYGRSDTDVVQFAGTSVAAPHATAVAALYLADHPKASPAEVESALLVNAGSAPGTPLLYSGFLNPDSSPSSEPPAAAGAPGAEFSVSCHPKNRTCSFDASASSGDLATWTWDLGDGASALNTTSDERYRYGSSGTYQVTLTVTDTAGQTASVTRPVDVP